MKKILARLLGRNSKSGSVSARPLPIELAKRASKTGQLQAYQYAWAELEAHKPQAGLWARSYADANGDETVARHHYLKMRVPQLLAKQTAKPPARVPAKAKVTTAAPVAPGRPKAMPKTKPIAKPIAKPQPGPVVSKPAAAPRPLIPGHARATPPQSAPILDSTFAHEEIELLPLPGISDFTDIEPEPMPFQELEIEQPVSKKPQSAKQKKLLEQIAKVRKGGAGQVLSSEPESIDRWGCTRLMRVAQRGEYDAVLELLAEGDDPLVTDSSGLSARGHAEVQGNTSCAELLDAAEQVWEQQGRI